MIVYTVYDSSDNFSCECGVLEFAHKIYILVIPLIQFSFLRFTFLKSIVYV